MICPECGAHRGRRMRGVRTLRGRQAARRPGRGRQADAGRRRAAARCADQHHVQPARFPISQSSELGTVYTVAELALLAPPRASTGCCSSSTVRGWPTLRQADFDCAAVGETGVDVLTFGGTKNGLLFGEAIVFLRADLALPVPVCPQAGDQLASKMRFVSAQFEALLTDDRWRASAPTPTGWRAARRAACAARGRAAGLPGRRPTASSRELPPAIEPLQRERPSGSGTNARRSCGGCARSTPPSRTCTTSPPRSSASCAGCASRRERTRPARCVGLSRRHAPARPGDGPLAGSPFGVKDIIDVAGMPTGLGLNAVRRAWRSATPSASRCCAPRAPCRSARRTPRRWPRRSGADPDPDRPGADARAVRAPAAPAAVAAGEVPLPAGNADPRLGPCARPRSAGSSCFKADLWPDPGGRGSIPTRRRCSTPAGRDRTRRPRRRSRRAGAAAARGRASRRAAPWSARRGAPPPRLRLATGDAGRKPPLSRPATPRGAATTPSRALRPRGRRSHHD